MRNRTTIPGKRQFKKCVAVWLGAAFALSMNSRAAIPPVEKLLPADTLLMITVPDCARMRAIYAKSPQSQFWNDPAMKPFRDKFTAKWRDEFVAPLERDLGVKFDDYAALPQGLLTFAVTQDGWDGQDGQPPGALLLLDTKDKSDQLKKNLAELRKKWADAGKPIKTEKIRDVEFSVVPVSSNDVPKTLTKFFPRHQEVQELGKESEKKKDSDTSEIVVGQFESLLIVGSSTKTVEKVVARLTGGSAPSLGEQAAYEANRLALFRDAPLYGWFNTKAFIDILLRLPPEKPNPDAPSPMPMLRPEKVVAALGLTGLKTVAFDFHDSGDGNLFEVFFGAPEAGRQGLFRILTAEAKDSNPPSFVPADAVKFQRWRVDGQKAWAAFEKMLGDISPQALNTWNFVLNSANLAAQEKDPGYDLKKNLIGNLGDDLIGYEKAPPEGSPTETKSPPSILLIGSPNAGQLAGALKGPLLIFTPQAAAPEERDFLGRKIYTVTLGTLPLGVAATAPHALSYAASGGYVAISPDASMVEEFLRSSESKAKPLREMPGLADAAQKAGGAGSGLFGYENQSERWRALFEALRKDSGAATNASGFNPLANALPFASPEKNFRAWMDFSLLPSFDKVAKYFSYAVYSGSATTDGLTFKMFAPVPPQLQK